MEFIRKNLLTFIIVLATVVLAGIAIFTAVRLYQLRQQSVAPNAPESKPRADTLQPSPAAACTLTFQIAEATATPTETATASPTATPTTPPSCDSSCTDTTNSSDCPTGMTCTQSGGTNVCRNTSCTDSADCICATATPTATPTPTPTPTAPPSCGSACTSTTECGTGMTCTGNVCRNTSCTTETDCICATVAPTTPPSLPEAGTSWPTLIGIGAGLGTLLLAIFLAL